MPTRSGSGFLPLGNLPYRNTASWTGAANQFGFHARPGKTGSGSSTPGAYLDDKRPTKITIKPDFVMGGMFYEDEYDYNRRTAKQPPEGVNRDIALDGKHPQTHTVTVGDLCFVALGQIVNRHFNAVRYQPTACIMINSPTYSAALRKAIRKEWGNLTPGSTRNFLVRDFLQPDYENRRIGACLRANFYPKRWSLWF